jgi:hypothetical protein
MVSGPSGAGSHLGHHGLRAATATSEDAQENHDDHEDQQHYENRLEHHATFFAAIPRPMPSRPAPTARSRMY